MQAKSKYRLIVGGILFSGLLLYFGQGMANEAARVCAQDYKKFCAGIQPGDGRIGRCLMENKNDISQQCRYVLEQATRKLLGEFVQACQTDVQKYCEGVKPGDGRILNCLRGEKENISEPCRQVVDKIKG